MKAVATIFAALLCVASPAKASDTANAQYAYNRHVDRFWRATAGTAQLVSISGTNVGAPCVSGGVNICDVPGAAGNTFLTISGIWESAIGWAPVYSKWKVDGDVSAQAALSAQWSYLKNWITPSDANSCTVAARRIGSALDDLAWAATGFIQLYEASGDSTALNYAARVIDCAWTNYHDATDGGLWYDYPGTYKSADQGSFALAMVLLYQAGGSTTGLTTNWSNADVLTEAQALMEWINTYQDYTNNSVCTKSSHLLWMKIPGSGTSWTPTGCANPFSISMTASPTGLAENMGYAAANARMWSITSNATWKTRAQNTAASIYQYERDVNGAWLDDRDARVGGFSAWYFANDVIPILPNTSIYQSTYLTTGRCVMSKDSLPTGEFGGDWCGPARGVWWSAGYSSSRIEITASAAIWPIVAKLWAN